MLRGRSQTLCTSPKQYKEATTENPGVEPLLIRQLDLVYLAHHEAMRRLPNVPRLELGTLGPIQEVDEDEVPLHDRTRAHKKITPAKGSCASTSMQHLAQSGLAQIRVLSSEMDIASKVRAGKPIVPRLPLAHIYCTPTDISDRHRQQQYSNGKSSASVKRSANPFASAMIVGSTWVEHHGISGDDDLALLPLEVSATTNFSSLAKVTPRNGANLSDDSLSSDEEACGNLFHLSDSQVELLQAELDAPATRRFSSPSSILPLPLADHRDACKPRSNSDPMLVSGMPYRSRSCSALEAAMMYCYARAGQQCSSNASREASLSEDAAKTRSLPVGTDLESLVDKKSFSDSHIYRRFLQDIQSEQGQHRRRGTDSSTASVVSRSTVDAAAAHRHATSFASKKQLKHSPIVHDFRSLVNSTANKELISPAEAWVIESQTEEPNFVTPRIATDVYARTFLAPNDYNGIAASSDASNQQAGTNKDEPSAKMKRRLHYVGEHRTLGPVVVTVSKCKGSSSYTALLSTRSGDISKTIAKEKVLKSFNRVSERKLLKAISEELTPRNLVKTTDPQVSRELTRLDQLVLAKLQTQLTFKFGLLYVKEAQRSEEEIFGNVCGSDAWDEFLEFIGDRVDLRGWGAYNGGLDVSEETRTGVQSIYKKWQDKELMFHVSTLLPYHPTKTQQVERKRHIGNDVVCLVFKDGNTPFEPDAISTQFTHVYVVVKKDETSTKERTFYRVWVCRKRGVPCFKPALPDSMLFEKGDEFRRFLYGKLVNGERAAGNSEQFKTRMIRSRNMLLRDLKEKFCPPNFH